MHEIEMQTIVTDVCSVCQSVCPSLCQSVRLSVSLSACYAAQLGFTELGSFTLASSYC